VLLSTIQPYTKLLGPIATKKNHVATLAIHHLDCQNYRNRALESTSVGIFC